MNIGNVAFSNLIHLYISCAGDNWLVQCLRCLYNSKGLLYRAVPADQGFLPQDQYAGVFRYMKYLHQGFLPEDQYVGVFRYMEYIHRVGRSIVDYFLRARRRRHLGL
jgi:hypothetical protein